MHTDTPQQPEEMQSAAVMSLSDHVEALRGRLIRAIIGVSVVSVVMFWHGRAIVWWLCQPLFVAQRQLGLPLQTVNLSVAGGFSVYVKVSLVAGLALGGPWVVYQIWKFVAPGLRSNERRVFRLLVPYSAAMTAASLFFMYYLFLPAALSFLLMFSLDYPAPNLDAGNASSLERVTRFFNRVNAMVIPGAVQRTPGRDPAVSPNASAAQGDAGQRPQEPAARGLRLPVLDQDPPDAGDGEIWLNRPRGEIRLRDQGQTRIIAMASTSFMVPLVEINEYLGFVLWMALVLVIAFQLPVAMTVAAALGMLDPWTIARYRGYIIFGCFFVGIIVTPNQDIVSNIVFPILLWGLFEIGLVTGRLAARPQRAQAGLQSTR